MKVFVVGVKSFKLVMPIAVDIYLLAGKTDRLWRKIHRLYVNQQLSNDEMAALDTRWENLHWELYEFLDELHARVKEWDDVSYGDNRPFFVLPFSQRQKVYKQIFDSFKTIESSYRPQVNTDIGRRMFELSNITNRVLLVLEKFCRKNTQSLAFKAEIYDVALSLVHNIRVNEAKDRKRIDSLMAKNKRKAKKKNQRR